MSDSRHCFPNINISVQLTCTDEFVQDCKEVYGLDLNETLIVYRDTPEGGGVIINISFLRENGEQE